VSGQGLAVRACSTPQPGAGLPWASGQPPAPSIRHLPWDRDSPRLGWAVDHWVGVGIRSTAGN